MFEHTLLLMLEGFVSGETLRSDFYETRFLLGQFSLTSRILELNNEMDRLMLIGRLLIDLVSLVCLLS